MAMFGSSLNRRPRPMNEQAMTGPMPSALAAPQLQTQPMPMLPQTGIQSAPQRGGGVNFRNIAGVLGDALAQASGGQARFLPQMMHDREQQRQLQLQQQQQAEQRTYEQAVWQQRQDYQRAHPDPQQPTEMERVLQAAGFVPGSPQYIEQMRTYARNRADPMQTINNGDGTFTLVRPSQLQPQTAPARPAIGETVADPRRAGGQTPPASANFPPIL